MKCNYTESRIGMIIPGDKILPGEIFVPIDNGSVHFSYNSYMRKGNNLLSLDIDSFTNYQYWYQTREGDKLIYPVNKMWTARIIGYLR